MGACTFTTVASGKTMSEAFDNAVKQAQYDYGHRGYTGTIAEKHQVVLINGKGLPVADATKLANELIDKCDERIDDKWGPCGAIKIDTGEWLFFGWASE